MDMYKGLIYCAISPSNKKYYGFTLKPLTNRIAGHTKRMKEENKLPIYNALRKYGVESFKWQEIETYELDDKMALKLILYEREIYWIEKDKTYLREFGYNISHGGTGSDIFSSLSDERKKEVRKAISDNIKIKWNDPAYRNKLLKIRKTLEYKKRISKHSNKIWKDPIIRAKMLKSFDENVWHNPLRNSKISNSLKNKAKEKCKYCGFETNNASNMKRWHNENCKYKNT